MKYDIYINSYIGWPFSAEYVRQELKAAGDGPVNVYISSLGGSVADALQIRQMFTDHGDVTVYLHGLVASAATIIAMGARRVVMGSFAMLMIHRCSNWVEGWEPMNADEIADFIKRLGTQKEELETFDRTVASIYAARCKRKVEDIVKWMIEARWLTARECMERGLVDMTTEEDQQPEITDAFRGQIVACGLPVPVTAQKEDANEARGLLAKIKALFDRTAGTPQNSDTGALETQETHETQNQTQTINTAKTMSKTYKHIMNALKAQELEEKDGHVTMNAEQLGAIDGHIADLDKKVTELEAQVKALKEADGAETDHVEDNAGGEQLINYAAQAREDYKKLRNI